jgi:prepilin-type processing-associated H-X9-DG protein
VELLVVIAIIGVLVALLLPAVQAAREAARRSQCGNNFRQAGLALHNYHDAVRKFPPGTIMWMHGLGPNCGAPGSAGDYYGFGWSTLILPYLEENTIYDQFDFKLQMSGEFNVNFVTGGKRIETYLCPSDPNGGGLADFSSGGQNGVDPREDLRATNMAAVSDSTDWTCDTNQLWPKELRKANGTFGERDGCRMKQITDGTSKTLLVGEVTGDIPTNYSSFVWASFNLADTLDGINGPFSLPGGVYASTGPGGILGFRKSGFSSWHPGGCHFVLADGSVRFIADSISAHLLSAYTTRAGGEASNDELP